MPQSNIDRLRELNEKLKAKLSQKSTSVEKKDDVTLFDMVAAKKEADAASQLLDAEDRKSNIQKLKRLFDELGIAKKVNSFEKLFKYKAMNLSGIGLKEEDFGEIRKGKYIQIIAITYEPDISGKKRAKNISLGYFGKAQGIEDEKKRAIVEFVLRWRFEKAYQGVDHYAHLLALAKEIGR